MVAGQPDQFKGFAVVEGPDFPYQTRTFDSTDIGKETIEGNMAKIGQQDLQKCAAKLRDPSPH
jgi:hypothetical protein